MNDEFEIVYRIPGMRKMSTKKDIVYKTIEESELKLDIYYPEDYRKEYPLPAVIFIHGDGPSEYLQYIKDSAQYVGWGQLVAASGMIAIVANHRSTEHLHNVAGVANDVDDLFIYVHEHGAKLGIDTGKIAIWTCSAGAYIGLRAALHEEPAEIRGIACYYGYTELRTLYQRYTEERDEASTITVPFFDEEDLEAFSGSEQLKKRHGDTPPIFIARAGLDNPLLNQAQDEFVQQALKQNLPITVMNHPDGQHGFDVVDNNDRSREIVQATLEFFKAHLLQ